ncbi:MAG: hypothetical protein QOI10_3469 [Solirubrobacterales bacterium]|jgi:hypothetical protein|nr:hypothetical protein [Solirubrobacterales bacterium]
MGRDIVKGWVASTARIPKYGGVETLETALEYMAERLASNEVPLLAEHDPLRPIDAKVLVAEVREMGDGRKGLWVEIDVPRGAMDDMRGFSYGLLVQTGEHGRGDDPPAGLYADPDTFSDEEVEQAAARLASIGLRVESGQVLQFAVDPITVIVVMVLWPVLVNVGSSFIYDAIKDLTKPGRPTEIKIEIAERPDGTTTTAVVKTDDPAVAEKALETLSNVADDAVRLTFEDERWREAQGPPPVQPQSDETAD